jgi:hypothetical protein
VAALLTLRPTQTLSRKPFPACGRVGLRAQRFIEGSAQRAFAWFRTVLRLFGQRVEKTEVATVVTRVVNLRREEFDVYIDKIIKDVITGDEKLANMVSICMKDSVEWQAVRLLAKGLFKERGHVKGILARVKPDENGRVTRWHFYNAVTNYVSTSGSRLKPQIDAWLQNKAQRILKTPMAQLTEELVTVGGQRAA